MKPTYEQLEQKLRDADEKIRRLEDLLKKALENIAELEKKLGRNSKNSSKAPSSDQKGNTPDPDKKKKRTSHPGKARTPYPPERVNRHVNCERESCPHCCSNKLQELSENPFAWQQVELPVVEAIVTQFNCLKYRCQDCGQRSVGDLPEGVPFSAFGPKLMALIVTLTGRFHVAKREAMQLINDLYEIELSEGSIINIEENVSRALDEVYERIHCCVIKGIETRYFDETSWRDSGKRSYVWIATSVSATYYRIDPSRSQEAFFRLIGTNTQQPAVTDRYGAYNALDGPHQYCLAHLIRDFHSFAECEGEDGRVGDKIEQELRKICKIQSQWRKGEISKQQRALRLSHAKRRLDEFFTDAIAFGSDDLAGLCQRLSDGYEHLWAFVSTEGMDPTNNMAERDLRKLVLWRKKSYGTRSARGQRFVERITSVVETLKKNGRSVLRFLEDALFAFFQKQPAPYIEARAGF